MFKDSKGSKNYKDSKRILNIFGIFGIFGSFRVFEHSDKNGGGVAGSKPDGDGKCIGMRNALFVPFGFLKHAYKCLKTPEIPKVPKIPKNLRNPRDLWNVWHLWTFGNEWWGRCRIQTRWGWKMHSDWECVVRSVWILITCMQMFKDPKDPRDHKDSKESSEYLGSVGSLDFWKNKRRGRCRIQTRWGWNPHPDCTALRKRDRLPSQNMHADA